jgi:hypothetical protein
MPGVSGRLPGFGIRGGGSSSGTPGCERGRAVRRGVSRRVGDGVREGGRVALADAVSVGVIDDELEAETDPRAMAEAEADAAEADAVPDRDGATHVAGGPDVDGAAVDDTELDDTEPDDTELDDTELDDTEPDDTEPDDTEGADGGDERDGDRRARVGPADAVRVAEEAPPAVTEADGDAEAQGVGVAMGCVAPMAPTVMRMGTVPKAMAATRTATVRGIVRRAWSMLGSPVWLGSGPDGGA